MCFAMQEGNHCICALFVQKFMSAEVFLDNREKLEAAMCFAMREGNHLYEKQCLSRLLSMDEVVSLYPELEVSCWVNRLLASHVCSS